MLVYVIYYRIGNSKSNQIAILFRNTNHTHLEKLPQMTEGIPKQEIREGTQRHTGSDRSAPCAFFSHRVPLTSWFGLLWGLLP